jgi:hypothetical protein
MDRHRRVYILKRLRPMLEKAKELLIKREDDTAMVKPLQF